MFAKRYIVIICFLILFVGIGSVYGEMSDPNGWETRAEFSYVNASGMIESQALSSKLTIKKETEKVRHYINTNIHYGEQYNNANDTYEKTINKWVCSHRRDAMVTEKLFYFSFIETSKNEFSDCAYTALAGPGFGYDVLTSKKHSLKLLLSTLYAYDNLKESESNNKERKYSSEKTAIEYKWNISEDYMFKNNIDYLHSFEDNNKYIINSETVFEIKVSDSMSLGLSYVVLYENDMPLGSQNIAYTEKTFSTSLIYNL